MPEFSCLARVIRCVSQYVPGAVIQWRVACTIARVEALPDSLRQAHGAL